MKTQILLVRNTITGKLLYCFNIGGVIRYFKSENGAHRALKNLGYTTDFSNEFYTKTHYSTDEMWFNLKIKKIFK